MIRYLPFYAKGGEFMNLMPVVEGAGTAVTAADWASIITAITGQISVSTVVAAVATMVSAGIGLVFMWWGVLSGYKTPVKIRYCFSAIAPTPHRPREQRLHGLF